MKIVRLSSPSNVQDTWLQLPDDVDFWLEWERWEQAWRKQRGMQDAPPDNSFAKCELLLAFVEFLIWQKGCKYPPYEEAIL